MSRELTESDLESYLDEALPTEMMAVVEETLRDDQGLRDRLAGINARRDAGVHSLGEIWRRERLSCPSREDLGSFLLQALPEELRQYVDFHLEVVGCRFCQANLDDLRQQATDREAVDQRDMTSSRRRKYFQSSAGYLKR